MEILTDDGVITGDCYQVMAKMENSSVDHIICDPPYSARVHSRLGLERRKDGAKKRDELDFEAMNRARMSSASLKFCRLAKRWIIIFCDEISLVEWRQCLEEAGAEYVRMGTWVKSNPMPQMTGDRPAVGTEQIAIFHAPRKRGRMQWNGGGRPATYIAPSIEPGIRRFHPTQKPLCLMEAVIRDFTNPGDIVLDPFAGAGSTLVACKRLGREALGIERNNRYAESARLRLREAQEQLDMFQEESHAAL